MDKELVTRGLHLLLGKELDNLKSLLTEPTSMERRIDVVIEYADKFRHIQYEISCLEPTL